MSLTGHFFFRINLELEYEGGLLFAKNIEVLSKKDSILTPTDMVSLDSVIDSSYNRNVPPPPPPPTNYIDMGIIPGCFLCGNCIEKKLITHDRKRKNYWLKKKYEYQELKRIDHRLLLAKKNNLFGIINFENEVKVPIAFDKIESNNWGRLRVWQQGKCGIYNFKGQVFLPVEYDNINTQAIYTNDMKVKTVYIVEKEGKFGAYNKNGDLFIPLMYDHIELFLSQYFVLKKGKKYGVLSMEGKVSSDFNFSEIDFRYSFDHRIIKTKNKKGKTEYRLLCYEGDKMVIKKIKIK
ncbi:MAG: WG repeat-containing protein [Bacteroidota bacterium]